MRNLCVLAILLLVAVAARSASAQVSECPADKVCLSQQQAAKYLTLEDTTKAQETEILALKQAVLDQKLVTMDAKIALAEKSGENSILKQQLVDVRGDFQYLLAHGRKRCVVLCVNF